MSKKRVIIIAILGLVAGLAIGSLGTLVVIGRTSVEGMRIVSLDNRAELESRVHQAYYDQESGVAIWALENLIGVLRRQAQLFPDEPPIRREIVLDHARLSVLYSRVGREADAHKAMNEAIREAKEVGFQLDSEEELKAFLDRQLQAHRLKSEK